MSSNPLVTIIIPVYNVEKYLSQCLDSVVNQTYSRIEVILINDGSKDGSDIICQRYARDYAYINYVKRDNAGASATRNYGIKLSSGEFIFFLDSDDYLDKNCISVMVDVAMSKKLVVTGYMIDDTSCSSVTIPLQNNGDYDSICSFLLDFHKYFATKFNYPWGKLFKKDIIDKYQISFIESMSLSEDVLFNIEYYKNCPDGVAILEYKGYIYRQTDNTTLSKKYDPRMFAWNETAYCKIRDFLIDNCAMTPRNRSHFYTNVLGNLFYSTELLSLQSTVRWKEKVRQIRKYTSTDLANDAFSYSSHNDVRRQIMAFLLRHHLANTYIILIQLIRVIKIVKRYVSLHICN